MYLIIHKDKHGVYTMARRTRESAERELALLAAEQRELLFVNAADLDEECDITTYANGATIVFSGDIVVPESTIKISLPGE